MLGTLSILTGWTHRGDVAGNPCGQPSSVARRGRRLAVQGLTSGGVMADETEDFDGMVIARVVITRVMSDDDIIDHVIAATEDGDELGLAEALGMMRLAEDTLIRSRQEAAEDDE
jgi:hypothetical protein